MIAAIVVFRIRQMRRAGEYRKARGIHLRSVHALRQNIQPEQRSRLVRRNRRERGIIRFGNVFRRSRSIGIRERFPAVGADEFSALLQRLRMAHDRADSFHRRARAREEIVLDLQLDHAIDIQASGKHQIHHRADVAGIAVLDRQHRAIVFARFHGAIGFLKVARGKQLRIRKRALGGDMRKRALHAAVNHSHSLRQPRLIIAGRLHHIP